MLSLGDEHTQHIQHIVRQTRSLFFKSKGGMGAGAAAPSQTSASATPSQIPTAAAANPSSAPPNSTRNDCALWLCVSSSSYSRSTSFLSLIERTFATAFMPFGSDGVDVGELARAKAAALCASHSEVRPLFVLQARSGLVLFKTHACNSTPPVNMSASSSTHHLTTSYVVV